LKSDNELIIPSPTNYSIP